MVGDLIRDRALHDVRAIGTRRETPTNTGSVGPWVAAPQRHFQVSPATARFKEWWHSELPNTYGEKRGRKKLRNDPLLFPSIRL